MGWAEVILIERQRELVGLLLRRGNAQNIRNAGALWFASATAIDLRVLHDHQGEVFGLAYDSVIERRFIGYVLKAMR
jgi:hypothetical protein